MAKKNKKTKRQQQYDIKTFATKHFMVYVVCLLVGLPFMLFINYFLSENISGWTNLITVLTSLVMFLLVLLIATVISFKKERQENEKTKEEKRDPFAD